MEEYWDAYNHKREKLLNRICLRSEFPYEEPLYHLAVNVWVRHEDGDWLFVKRSADKKLYPNIYEAGAGGSVLSGEESLHAASRELVEETGLEAQDLQLLFSFTEDVHLTHFDTYLARVKGNKTIHYQSGETDAHLWVAEKDLSPFFATYPTFENQKQQILSYLQRKE